MLSLFLLEWGITSKCFDNWSPWVLQSKDCGFVDKGCRFEVITDTETWEHG